VRHRSSLVPAAFAALVWVLSAGHAAAQGRISGIVNDESGKPIKAATVTAHFADSNLEYTATTDDRGRFSLLGLRSGRWRFVASAPGYFADEGTANVRSTGASNPPIGFSLKKTSLLAGTLGGVTAKDLQAQLTEADALFSEKKWDQSIEAYRKVGQKTPSLTTINLQIAAAQFNKGDYDAAMATYADMLAADGGNEWATVGLARARIAKGDAAGGEEVLLTAANREAPGREIFRALGDLAFDRNRPDEAAPWYQKAADLDPSWGKAWYKLGLCAQKMGDNAGASGFMNKVLAVDPASPEAAMARATLDQLNR
jgi:Flp pilus assembly protein TadD